VTRSSDVVMRSRDHNERADASRAGIVMRSVMTLTRYHDDRQDDTT